MGNVRKFPEIPKIPVTLGKVGLCPARGLTDGFYSKILRGWGGIPRLDFYRKDRKCRE